MELFDILNLYRRCYQGVVIEDRKKRVYKAISKDFNKMGEDVFIFRQTNTEDVPLQFSCTYQEYSDAYQNGKIKEI